ncbi:MAG: NAD-dependent epimerase/dehydratase family protein [Geminocystis sp.]|nr:NAD-dependent epimerase/dehydratase family protein [Geminocystis sp.]HIK38707.1 NAD-dependent epimerase/dehydratase family protein [Geminocystis sp. M7585_C2015_104]MCS7147031.1 NAD-dependent epimerase/dehydratase family protein [Geminocystis sp.]MCX8077342.1 NAD-dependent epimerase/dehydratase family protein [Geminocystis sp.]MDW8115854.1 NAD-dependent epimerase/dehydratase family protein [Geminocystis sp.]
MKGKVFVTGASGFIGANLVRLLLERNYRVKALVRKNSNLSSLQGLDLELVIGDLNDDDLSEKMQGCDYLFHVAAVYSLWQKDKELLYKTNVFGTRNVFKSAREAGIKRIVYTSSVAAIGVREDGVLADEEYQSPVEKLIGNYKKSKYYAEQEAHFAVELGQDIVIVNPTTPIGAYDSKPTPTGEIILRFLRGKMPAFVNTGLNFIHVKDVAMGHILALEKGKAGRRYILGSQNLTLAEFLEKVAEVVGKSPPKMKLPHWLPLTIAYVDEYILTKLGKSPSLSTEAVKMSSQYMYYNPSRAIRELGLPQTDITLAIQEAVAWFKDYFKIQT